MENLRKGWGSGTFSLNVSTTQLHAFYNYLKLMYQQKTEKKTYKASLNIGCQDNDREYFIINDEVHISDGSILHKSDHRYIIPSTDLNLRSFRLRCISDFTKGNIKLVLESLFNHIMEAFEKNSTAVMLGIGFTLTQLLSPIIKADNRFGHGNLAGILYSEHVNVGKTTCLILLARLCGIMEINRHPLLCAGGDGMGVTGSSTTYIDELMARSSVPVFIDDPKLGRRMGGLIVRLFDGFCQGTAKHNNTTRTTVIMTSNELPTEDRILSRVLPIYFSKGKPGSLAAMKAATDTSCGPGCGILLPLCLMMAPFIKKTIASGKMEAFKTAMGKLMSTDIYDRQLNGLVLSLFMQAVARSFSGHSGLMETIRDFIEDQLPKWRKSKSYNGHLDVLFEHLKEEMVLAIDEPLTYIHPYAKISPKTEPGQSSPAIAIAHRKLNEWCDDEEIEGIRRKYSSQFTNAWQTVQYLAIAGSRCTLQELRQKQSRRRKTHAQRCLKIAIQDIPDDITLIINRDIKKEEITAETETSDKDSRTLNLNLEEFRELDEYIKSHCLMELVDNREQKEVEEQLVKEDDEDELRAAQLQALEWLKSVTPESDSSTSVVQVEQARKSEEPMGVKTVEGAIGLLPRTQCLKKHSVVGEKRKLKKMQGVSRQLFEDQTKRSESSEQTELAKTLQWNKENEACSDENKGQEDEEVACVQCGSRNWSKPGVSCNNCQAWEHIHCVPGLTVRQAKKRTYTHLCKSCFGPDRV